MGCGGAGGWGISCWRISPIKPPSAAQQGWREHRKLLGWSLLDFPRCLLGYLNPYGSWLLSSPIHEGIQTFHTSELHGFNFHPWVMPRDHRAPLAGSEQGTVIPSLWDGMQSTPGIQSPLLHSPPASLPASSFPVSPSSSTSSSPACFILFLFIPVCASGLHPGTARGAIPGVFGMGERPSDLLDRLVPAGMWRWEHEGVSRRRKDISS